MNFDEYWQSVISRGLPDRADLKDSAKLAWDAAICQGQAACLDHGNIRDGRTIMDELHKLHTW
jgi:hypothetical protein